MIEGLIGPHLLVLCSEKGLINKDNLEAYNYTIGLYENKNYVNNDLTLEVVNNMKDVSKKIFNKFWEKPKRNKKGK